MRFRVLGCSTGQLHATVCRNAHPKTTPSLLTAETNRPKPATTQPKPTSIKDAGISANIVIGASTHRLEASRCSNTSAGCQPAPFGSNRAGFFPELPARAARKQFWCLRVGADRQHAPLRSKPGAQRPVRAASPLRLEAAQKQFSCSQASAGCEPAMLGSDVGAASPHRLEASLALTARSAWKQLCCSKIVRAAARTARKQRWCSRAAAGGQPALLGSSFGAQRCGSPPA